MSLTFKIKRNYMGTGSLRRKCKTIAEVSAVSSDMYISTIIVTFMRWLHWFTVEMVVCDKFMKHENMLNVRLLYFS